MEICNKCHKKGEIVKPGLRCRKCCNEYKASWHRVKKDRKCEFCEKEFVPNGPAKECSLRCKLLNRIVNVNGCWEWQGKITNCGYGEITHHRKYMLVHRCSYKEFKEEIPKGLFVCHSCDNKRCINPEHLWTGTPSANIQDALKKNLTGAQKLKYIEVGEIRKLISEGAKVKDISKKYNVSLSCIYSIKNEQKWNKTR